MRKLDWMSSMYVYICEDYIKNKPETAKETLEKILFLMQYDSLQDKKNKKPFIPYKIYIDKKKIRIRYISDIFRVTRAIGNFWLGGGKSWLFPWHSIKNERKYIILSRKYKKMSEEAIEERVKNILETGELDSKYFIYGKYEDKFMRRLARVWVLQEHHRIKFYIWIIALALTLSMVIAFIFLPLILVTDYKEYVVPLNRYITFGIITIISSLLFYLWTKVITKPTQFEIDHDYVDK